MKREQDADLIRDQRKDLLAFAAVASVPVEIDGVELRVAPSRSVALGKILQLFGAHFAHPETMRRLQRLDERRAGAPTDAEGWE